MDIEFKRGKEAGKVSIGMKKHILKAIDMFQDDITRDAHIFSRIEERRIWMKKELIISTASQHF